MVYCDISIGLRVCDLQDFEARFVPGFKALVEAAKLRHPDLQVNVDAEIAKYREYAEVMKEYTIDSVAYVNDALKAGKKVMVEGANATMLDIDFGTYPFVTSSNPSIGGSMTGLGIPPTKIGSVVGIVKAYTTRVGSGPFPTELSAEAGIGKHLLDVGHEYGTTTGRSRRCGWLDLTQLRYSQDINGFTHIALTKLDVLTGIDTLKIATHYKLDGKELPSFPASLETLSKVELEYRTFPGWTQSIADVRKYEDLPKEARDYIEFIESQLEVTISHIGVGPARDAIITRGSQP